MLIHYCISDQKLLTTPTYCVLLNLVVEASKPVIVWWPLPCCSWIELLLEWLLLSWLLHKQKREFSDNYTHFGSENLADILTECFSLHQDKSRPDED